MELLKEKNINIRVIDIHTIKPIDRELIIKCAKETKKIITIEDHSVIRRTSEAQYVRFLQKSIHVK